MLKFLVTYDLQDAPHDPHGPFLTEAATLGWGTWSLSKSNVWCKLPNTTLRGEFATLEAAVQSFKRVWAETEKLGYDVNIEKWIVVQFDDASYGSDEKQPNE